LRTTGNLLRSRTVQEERQHEPGPPGPIQMGINRFIGVAFSIAGLGLLVGGILILS
jgi:hypothetical protein